MKKINIDQKYFEERLTLIKAAEDETYRHLRSVDIQEMQLKQARQGFNAELTKLDGEKRFIKAILTQYEINSIPDEKLDTEEKPKAGN